MRITKAMLRTMKKSLREKLHTVCSYTDEQLVAEWRRLHPGLWRQEDPALTTMRNDLVDIVLYHGMPDSMID